VEQKDIIESSITDAIHHIGMIVRDADRTAAFYESLGIGPFKPLIFDSRERKLGDKTLAGLKLKLRMGHVGDTRLEMIQPLEGEGPWFDFLAKHGEGVAHIAFVVKDIEKSKAELVARGLKVVYESWFQNGGAAAYLESDELGGILLEIFQRPSDYVPRKK